MRRFVTHGSRLIQLERLKPRGLFARNVATLAGTAAIGQAVSIFAAPLITRIYSVPDFGRMQAYLAALMFILVIACGRYEATILMARDEVIAANLTVVSLVLALITSLAVAAGIWRLTALNLGGHFLAPLRAAGILLPASILGASCYSALSQWVLRQRSYRLVGKSKISQAVGMSATQIVFGKIWGLGFIGLVIGDAVGRISGTLSFVKLAWEKRRESYQLVTLQGMLSAARRYGHFPLVSAPAALINSASATVLSFLLAGLYSQQVLGWYALTDRVLAVPLALIGTAISQVFAVEAAKLAREDPRALNLLLFRTIRKLAWVGLPPFALVAIFGPWLFSIAFGDKWREAGHYAHWLGVMDYVGFVVWPVLPTLTLLERQGWQFAWDLGRLGTTVAAICLAKHFGWNASSAIATYSGVMLVYYAIHPLLSSLALSRHHTTK